MGLQEIGEAKRQVAGRLTPRRVGEPQRGAVEEDADRHAGLAKQPLEPRVWAGTPTVAIPVRTGRLVQIHSGRNLLDQQKPFGGIVGIGQRIAGRQPVLVLRKRNRQFVRDRRAARRTPEETVRPLEDITKNGKRIIDPDPLVLIVDNQLREASLCDDGTLAVDEDAARD